MVNEFSTSAHPKRGIIAIHGWTGDVNSMDPVAKSFQLPDTQWVIPQAPYISNKKGYTWFDGNEETGWKYQESFDKLHQIIDNLEMGGISRDNIFLIGFSQGACLSMEFMIRQSYSLGGIIPIAGFIRYKENFKNAATNESKKTPILLLHGDQDEIVKPEESEIAKELFIQLGYQVELNLFSAGHKIPLIAKGKIQKFILN